MNNKPDFVIGGALRKPDFVIGGATRSGSRKLRDILLGHPEIYVPEDPAAQYFQRTRKRPEGSPPSYFDLELQAKTDSPHPDKLHGEWEDDAEKVAKHCPGAKIVFTLRNPVTRAYSQYWKSVREGKEKAKTFEQALDEEISGKRKPETTGRCWIYKSQYQIHLDTWFSLFPREQILVLIMEEWIDYPEGGLAPLEDFLKLERHSLRNYSGRRKKDAASGVLSAFNPFHKTGSGAPYPPMSDVARRELEEIFAVDKLYVANAMDRHDVEAWRPVRSMSERSLANRA